VHPRTDTRIWLKEVVSLGHALDTNISLFVQDGLGDDHVLDTFAKIVDTGLSRSNGRIARMTVGAGRMYRALRHARIEIAHFHDPELIPVGLLLRLHGVKVLYDVHEDLPRQILSKGYLNPIVRRCLSVVATAVEKMACFAFDGFFPATQTIADNFPIKKTETIKNFPIIGEFTKISIEDYQQRPSGFAYAGGLIDIRGSVEMVTALGHVKSNDIVLHLAGSFRPEAHQAVCENLSEWHKVVFYGWSGRDQIKDIFSKARAGLVVLHPTQNYPDALPVKMFEYMAAGLPVIASDFPLWRQIVDGAGCGLLVDPLDPQAIAKAMDWIIDNPVEAEAMGRRGRSAVETTYNWSTEADKLIAYYHDRLGVPMRDAAA
jgi:hypothetical protein